LFGKRLPFQVTSAPRQTTFSPPLSFLLDVSTIKIHFYLSHKQPPASSAIMASAARLERLRTLIRSEIDALPDRPVETEPDETVSDTEDGGISLNLSAEPIIQLDSTFVPAQSLPTASEADTDRQFVWMQGQQSSYNPAFDPKLSALPTVKLPPPTISRGDLVSVSEQFTPIGALAKYPYSFVDRNLMQGIASTFFDQSMWTITNYFSFFSEG
jgi:hypothetical protein